MLAVNFLIIFLSYRFGDNENLIDEYYMWLIILFTTILCLTSGFTFYHYIPNSHKNTFNKHYTWKQHLTTYYWDELTFEIDSYHREHHGQDAVRALMSVKYSIHYLPKEKLIDFFENRWAVWCDDPPEWFDDEFRERVPRELLVKVDESIWVAKTIGA